MAEPRWGDNPPRAIVPQGTPLRHTGCDRDGAGAVGLAVSTAVAQEQLNATTAEILARTV
ncbi:MAG: hypothetical protein H6526_02995 [Actinobacteria bacterium]|nr:hypothetical protein [Actinomycetota bacterium]